MKTLVKNSVQFISTIAIVCFASFHAIAEEVLNNASIIDLQKIGLSESTIVQKIKTTKCNFDTSISALKQLKSANVSDVIIQAMMSAPSGSSATMTAAAPSGSAPLASGNLNDPNTAHDLGIWLWQTENGKNKMTQLEPTVFAEMKTGSGWGMGWGGSAKMRVVLDGAKAKLQLSERKPVFYFYLGETSLGGPTSPDEFSLVKTELKENHDIMTRMIQVGKMSAYSSSRMGFDPKFVQPVETTKIAKGVYKVVPKDDLADGEYCIAQGATAFGAGGKGYDFGISGN